MPLPNLDECDTEEKLKIAIDKIAKIHEAQNKLAQFNSEIIGTSAIHPDADPTNWPAPHGQNVYKPKTNVLRESFINFIDNPNKLYEH